MKINSYEDLIVWQKSMAMVVEIYTITESFPREEIFGLRSQIRRAAVSVPSNIAEGSRRGTKKDFRNFLFTAYGSGAELETQLLLLQKLNFINEKDYTRVRALISEIMKMLNAFITNLKDK